MKLRKKDTFYCLFCFVSEMSGNEEETERGRRGSNKHRKLDNNSNCPSSEVNE